MSINNTGLDRTHAASNSLSEAALALLSVYLDQKLFLV